MARALTVDERLWARHLLQMLSEQCKPVRRAMDPQEGVKNVTDVAWKDQWESLKAALDTFTDDVMAGRRPTMNSTLGGRLGG
jgi:hypothetical protein